jgi:hypothetical protein
VAKKLSRGERKVTYKWVSGGGEDLNVSQRRKKERDIRLKVDGWRGKGSKI